MCPTVARIAEAEACARLCRILRSYPGDWQIHLVNEATGEADLVTTVPERPSYKACCTFVLSNTILRVFNAVAASNHI